MVCFEGRYREKGAVFVYDFDNLVAVQHHQALAIAQFQMDLFSRGPRSLQQLEIGGGADWILRMCAHLTTQELPDGSLADYEQTKVNAVLEFHKRIRGKDAFERQVEVVTDFLERHDKQEAVLALLLRDAVQLAALVHGQTQNSISSEPNESTVESSSPENSTAGL